MISARETSECVWRSEAFGGGAAFLHRRLPPRRHVVRRVCGSLEAEYHDRSLGNKRNPLDEYLYITLSLRTHEWGFQESFRRFKRAFPSWDRAYFATVREIARAIRPGGLARQKAARIRATLRVVKKRFGEVSLRKLKHWSKTDVEAFLMSLPGVGLKSARCIMMYSLGLDVLPVDTHVARVSIRLGWVERASGKELHRRLDDVIPQKYRFAYHVGAVQHGRAVCRGQHPRCGRCCLRKFCARIGC